VNKESTLAAVSGAKVDFRKGDPPNGLVYLLFRIDRLPTDSGKISFVLVNTLRNGGIPQGCNKIWSQIYRANWA